MDIKRIVILSIPAVVLLLAGIVWLFIRKTVRTRLRMATELEADPQINDWLVIFNWTRKVLYVPTILASLIAAGILFAGQEMKWFPLSEDVAKTIGGCWLAVFFLNFLIDEYEINVKTLLLIILAVGVILLWLALADLLTPFLQAFKHLGIEISALGYLLISMIFLLAIVISWIHGLFVYVTLTPNYLNISNGVTETSEQISREGYNTRIDTNDFLERLLGFGQIVITFSDTRRPPMVLLIGSVGKKAKALESIRGHLSVEQIPASVDGKSTGTA